MGLGFARNPRRLRLLQFECQGRAWWGEWGAARNARKPEGEVAFWLACYSASTWLTRTGGAGRARSHPRTGRARACPAPELPEHRKLFLSLSHRMATGRVAESGWSASTYRLCGAPQLASWIHQGEVKGDRSRRCTRERTTEPETRVTRLLGRGYAYEAPGNDTSSAGYDFKGRCIGDLVLTLWSADVLRSIPALLFMSKHIFTLRHKCL